MTESVVSTMAGVVRGRVVHKVHRFLGVPYAGSPVGAGRFRPPAPVAGWLGTRDATVPGPAAPQAPDPILPRFTNAAGFNQAEDGCLNLNIWTQVPDDGARPVLVWIHGGAFRTGRGSDPWFDGTRLALAHDIVVVTINYRLGPLGYLSLGEYLGEAFAGSGNLGVLDIVAALRWVRENIAAFGGDSGQVTIAGESAGAGMVSVLLASEEAQGLFRGAIMQSGGAMVLDDADAALGVTRRLLQILGIDQREARRLLDVKVEDLLVASERIIADESWVRGDRVAFRPMVDGIVLKGLPAQLVASGPGRPVPIVIGTNRDEGRMSLVLGGRSASFGEAHRAVAFSRGGKRAEDVYAHLSALTPAASDEDLAALLVTEDRFLMPSLRLADACVDHGTPVWMYRFDWRSGALDGALGACHALDLPFVFDNLDSPGVTAFTGDAPPRALATAMSSAWARFVRQGDPSSSELPWPAYERSQRKTLLFSEQCEVARLSHFWAVPSTPESGWSRCGGSWWS